MNTKVLSRVDLNLLVALQVLMEEQSVTRAAERLYITQPAMSKTLQRLRDLFDDPLFTRSGRGLVPTPRAIELEQLLPQVLGDVVNLVGREAFDPKVYEGEIHILAAEFIAVQIVPVLSRLLMEEAPNLTLTVSSEACDEDKGLEDGTMDFILEVARPYSNDVHITQIGGFTPAVWMRKGHPLADQDKVSLADILDYPFVQYYLLLAGPVSSSMESRFDREMAKRGLSRKKILVTNQLMTALDTLWHTDCLMLATMHDLKYEGDYYEIVRKPYPDELRYDKQVPAVLVQHARTLKSPVHQWVKEKIIGIVRHLQEHGPLDHN